MAPTHYLPASGKTLPWPGLLLQLAAAPREKQASASDAAHCRCGRARAVVCRDADTAALRRVSRRLPVLSRRTSMSSATQLSCWMSETPAFAREAGITFPRDGRGLVRHRQVPEGPTRGREVAAGLVV